MSESQSESSLLFKVFKSLEKSPVKNDWLSGDRKHSEEIEIHMSLNEIQLHKVQTYCEGTIKTAF